MRLRWPLGTTDKIPTSARAGPGLAYLGLGKASAHHEDAYARTETALALAKHWQHESPSVPCDHADQERIGRGVHFNWLGRLARRPAGNCGPLMMEKAQAKVLVVDDTPANLLTLSALLKPLCPRC